MLSFLPEAIVGCYEKLNILDFESRLLCHLTNGTLFERLSIFNMTTRGAPGAYKNL